MIHLLSTFPSVCGVAPTQNFGAGPQNHNRCPEKTEEGAHTDQRSGGVVAGGELAACLLALLLEGATVHERGENVDDKRPEQRPEERHDDAEVCEEACAEADCGDEADDDGVLELLCRRLHVEELQERRPEALECEGVAEEDGGADGPAGDGGEGVSSGVVVEDQPLRAAPERQEPSHHEHSVHEESAEEGVGGELAEALRAAVLELCEELWRVVVAQVAVCEHADEDERLDRRGPHLVERAHLEAFAPCGDKLREEDPAYSVRALGGAKDHEDHSVQQPADAEH
eukprot:CAMPEP_0202830146 /NCGR_PEP_ID=MMETSP1389-20130828/15972_1 /ASSEMBLY_ACC=CAM_ASM_000865 /TAXON_ID=302021 /ORGANISM="Rhodomonas sp., Strain CCMP768" /LENGTH=284 /DNA_ID=CAMNT_0049503759 /DNA_START=109 /DNA_END=964 /DNA_ORIENTATION=-